MKISQENKMNKRQENRRQNAGCLTDRLNLEGDTPSTCFWSPLCLPLGTEMPQARSELMLLPSWSLAQSYFWQFSLYDLNSSFWFHTRRAFASMTVTHTDPSEALPHIPNSMNLQWHIHYWFSPLEFLSQSSNARTPNRERAPQDPNWCKRFLLISIF